LKAKTKIEIEIADLETISV